ncbi:hypothetical protein FC40_GL000916 [Ligilactobacillus hayakitensis DSM 18933 = JCM 14209]|uniref:DNA mismatch repair protein MutS n=1 Tax=Ligilactobacillus hayakitensis DSM 18933 = JCM 14209 TaxID=1423755 RepID=A0A0R1WVL9_9LACO|nr:DNA mismatch repair protein MutS [Ligilactobacillus hayakitensis]KRM19126.1 hypothetical protein FC40_GL000916 [Ligilactobacillus hayakitensis DSM 18933 = JCM 14209]
MPQKTKNTPMMEQYLKIKAQYPDAFLFYRLGDFYEMFYDDAVKGSQILELTLTQRNKNAVDPIPMCGVPHHAAQNYIDILVDKGYKVAVCEQVEDPKQAKGMVKREVVQLITPGTILDTGVNDAKENNYLTAVYQSENNYGFAYVDLSTGEIRVTSMSDMAAIMNELMALRTKEVVVNPDFSEENQLMIKKLKILVSVQTEIKQSSEANYVSQGIDLELEKKVLGYLITYLKETQKRALAHLQKAIHYELSNYLKLDHYAKQNLELTRNSRTQKKSGTLLWLLDATKTAMGGRMLKQWIERPLIDIKQIQKRQVMVENLLENFFERSSLQEELANVYDLERLAGRIAFGNVNGRDLVQLKSSLEHIPQIQYLLNELNDGVFDDLIQKIDPLEDIADLIEQAVVDEPPISVTDGGIIRDGYDMDLDQYNDALRNGKVWLTELEAKERKETGINNLKIGFNKVFGYYIEVSKGNLKKLPEDRYQRKQTLTNAERFITPELKEKEALILGAQSKATELEYKLFVDLRDQIKDQIQRIQNLAKVISELDVLQSFAVVSEQGKFVKPQLKVDSRDLEIQEGWHPVVERVLGKQSYVPNDIQMTSGRDILLITGPNMSGKSTYMRQLALTVVMAQIGCFVPAKSAKMPIFDQIFTRIGAADDLISGESTFMVEMKETNQALQNATKNSLLLFDEIGRGTATFDGMALAQSIIEYVHDNIGAKTLFSTHYHELTVLDEELPHLSNVHVGAIEENGELIFLHKMQDGPADKSYGIHVAKLAGMPNDLLDRADVILSKLESQEVTQLQDKIIEAKSVNEEEIRTNTKKNKEQNNDDSQLSLFTPEIVQVNNKDDKLIKEIKDLDLIEMTPLDVMNVVYKWQKQLKKKG